MSTLARAARLVDAAAEALTSALLAVVVLVNGAELAARNFFNYSLAWAHEVNLLCATWVYFIGMTMVVHRKGDIVVEYVTQFLPSRAHRAWLAAVNLAVLAVLATVAWYCWVLIQLQAGFRTTGLGIPNSAFSAAVLAGAAIMAFHVVVQLVRREP